MNTIERTPIIIDTDPGHDDALALILLERSGLFDIKAITTVAGNSTIQNVTNNARYILDLLGSNAPLHSGASKPLKRELVQAVVHGDGGLAGADIIHEEPLVNDAVETLASIIHAHPHEVTIVVLGPQTNVAQAFIAYPELPKLTKQVVMMGGAIAVPGNKNRVGEFNIFVDPEAADVVFKAEVKKILVPLDACNDIRLQLSDFQTLKGTPLYEPLMTMMSEYITGILRGEKVHGALMYDPLAAYYLINPQAFTLESMDILIETTSELTRGMTVAERRTWGECIHNVDVVTTIDGKQFVRDFLKVLKS
jgi:pyrimidine-specific ribonucleoside hydrolase